MSKVGGLTTKFYRETKGLKVSGGQTVKAGSVLTRNGNKWKPGINVNGLMHLTAACDGEVYFIKKRGTYGKAVTFVNIRATEEKEAAKVAKKKVVKKAAEKKEK